MDKVEQMCYTKEMNAEETIIKDDDAIELIKAKYGANRLISGSQHRGVQAEISFKAGIKEVVDWVVINLNTDSRRDEWQTQLKEWGYD